jgi:hypothetical protein
MKWLTDLFVQQEKASLSRFWVNVILAVSTWIVIRMELTDRTSFEILGTYMGIVLGYEAAKRGMVRHYETSITRERIKSRVDNPD